MPKKKKLGLYIGLIYKKDELSLIKLFKSFKNNLI